LHVCYGHALGS